MITLSPKQNEYIRNSSARWNLKVGAVRSGKTYCDLAYIIPARIRAVAGHEGLTLIMGVSKETVERNVLRPMREIYTDRLVGTINNRNVAHIFGEEVYCLGAEKTNQVAKIQGMSVKYCYGDELAKWSPAVFAMLQSRLDKPYSKFDGACNPEYPNHWLKQFIDRDDIDAYIQKYQIFDNPFLSRDFVDNLCKEYEGTVYYDRYILGEWSQAEGLIYPMWKDAICEPPKGRASKYVLSIDYGTMNAFSAGLWGLYGDTWIRVNRYYYSGRTTGIQKTDTEYERDLRKMIAPIMEEREAEAKKMCTYYQKIPTIIDPSAASFIALLRKKEWYHVRPANNDVKNGIRHTAVALKNGIIRISADDKEWQSEVQGYVWEDTEADDVPVKINDHAMDETRYFVETMQLVKERKQTFSAFM